MNERVKYSVKTTEELLSSLLNAYYFMFMVEDKNVVESWVKAAITNVTGEYVSNDWRNHFEEVTPEEFAEEVKVLSNLLLMPFRINDKPLRKGLIIGKEPFTLLMFSDVNVVGFIIENHGDYETHYLLFNGFDIMTQENKKLLIKAKAQSNAGVLYRITSD
jgi:hypothetical protein